MKTKIIIVIFSIIIIILSSFIFIDIFPNKKEVIIDSDGDKVADKIDAFPNDPAASIDSDGDGYPDEWNQGKSPSDSTSNPPLIIDECPYDPEEYKDSDRDYVGDNKDAFPDNINEWSDIDLDGYGDRSDINPYVNLSFEIKIEKFKVTRKVDLLRWAQVYFVVKINGISISKINNNGNNFKVRLNQIKELNHEKIVYEIIDGTTKKFTDIEIIMYDYDFIGSDDIIDISNKLGEKTLKLRFDHIKNEISKTESTEGRNGKLWFNIIVQKEISINETFYNKSYTWYFKDNKWELQFKIPVNTYKNYQTFNVSRQPQSQSNIDNAMAAFVSLKERIILDLADELKIYANSENYNLIDEVNFCLKFVQNAITYRFDNETMDCEEYWKFPVETLVDQTGDCEDTSVLLASILDRLGFDVALLYYSWKEDGKRLGHLAVGVNLDGDYGSYVIDDNGNRYFYCETTTEGYSVGEIPSKIKGDPVRIVPI